VDFLDRGIIPNCYLNNSSFSIALAGAKSSGKSNYIAVLINEIRNKMAGNFHCNINISSDPFTKEEYDRKYYDPLFKQGRVVAATDKGEVRPLIFPIDFENGKMAALTFYDTAGENLDDNKTLATVNRYFKNANGVILLFDPLQVPSIREQLKGKLDLPAQNTDAVVILDRLMGMIKGNRSVKDSQKKIDIPLAVVLTKIDVLEKFGLLEESKALKRESRHIENGRFVQADFQAVDGQVRVFFEYLTDENNHEHEIMSKIRHFKTVGFFGLTSLGDIPKNNKIEDKIKPKRVLDPLLWFLAQNKFIKTSRFE
jgi:hypothetical protein